MKYSLDTYRMYRSESMFSHVIRIVVNMKDTVDPDILRHSVNIAVRRYPYFAVRVTVDKDGGYVLQPNQEPDQKYHSFRFAKNYLYCIFAVNFFYYSTLHPTDFQQTKPFLLL